VEQIVFLLAIELSILGIAIKCGTLKQEGFRQPEILYGCIECTSLMQKGKIRRLDMEIDLCQCLFI
jgi:hypothetical protein